MKDAIDRWVGRLVSEGLQIDAWLTEMERVRGQVANLVGPAPDEIAFVRNTSHGLGLVAEGLYQLVREREPRRAQIHQKMAA